MDFLLSNVESETLNVIITLLSFILCVMQLTFAFTKWKSKGTCHNRRRCGPYTFDAIERKESIIERILLKRGGNVLSLTAARGTLVRLKSSTLEMLIWYILHKQLRVNLRLLRLFPINHHRPVYTVEQILQGNTDELRSLQKIIFKDYGYGPKTRWKIDYRSQNETEKFLSDPSGKEIRNNGELTAANTKYQNGARFEESVITASAAVELHKDVTSLKEFSSLEGNEDDFDSPYEPANAMRKALTMIFSKVKSDVRAAASKENVHGVKSVDHMIEMIRTMFDPPNASRRRFSDEESFVDDYKLKESEATLLLRVESPREKNIVDERTLQPVDMSDDAKRTLKAYYEMAVGFSTFAKSESFQPVKQEEKSAYDITIEEWKSLEQIFRNGNPLVKNDSELEDFGQRLHTQPGLPGLLCSSRQRHVDDTIVDFENRPSKSSCEWNYSAIAIGSGAAALLLFIGYRYFR
ncbi:uncharacterized protein [Acropora muricata]|uniref:uncharacterized protein isoform X2 n=1 Tax=Acropora muricata TaxID=159855 RepID=UPI0034E56D2A